jgi:Fe-S-cluster containining protein
MLGDNLSFNYPKDVRFECTRCALCCGDTDTRVRHILLLQHEAETISRITSKPIEEFARKTTGRRPYAYEMKKTATKGKCQFLKDKTCIIYRSRPLICKFYPFQLKTARTGQGTFSNTKECLGVGKGVQLRRSYFEVLFEEAYDRLTAERCQA